MVKKSKETIKTKKEFKSKFGITPEELLGHGVHLGHSTSKLHPGMEPYILGMKNNVHVIDVKKTAQELEKVLLFIKESLSEGKEMLLLGTKPPLQNLVEETAKKCGFYFVSERWLGGTFTNFKTISKRLDYLKELEEKRKKGEFDKYTKKEQLDIDREIQKLQRQFKGIKQMGKLPDIIFILDINNNMTAVREAQKKETTIIGLCDTNVDPKLVDYCIPANNDALTSIRYILEKLTEVLEGGSKKKTISKKTKKETGKKPKSKTDKKTKKSKKKKSKKKKSIKKSKKKKSKTDK